MQDRGKALTVLTLNTVAFTVCFACWMMNGVLVTFLVERGVFKWNEAQMGWLIGIPVLTGSLVRLPVGMLTDKFGGRPVFALLMLASALPMFLMSYAASYMQFFWAGLGFGLTGASFAVGIAYTSVWFPKERQGVALGVFGAGNAGAALTSMGAPFLLLWLTEGGENLEGWRNLPRIYAGMLVLMAGVFYALTHSRKVEQHGHHTTLAGHLAPLRHMRVWRFGLYYFLVFGAFVALSQWLIPYYVSAYVLPVTTAGLMAAIFSLPSGVIRALGGWMSDHFGARRVMYWVLGTCAICCALLVVPRMDVETPGKGVLAKAPGTVSSVSEGEIVAGGRAYTFQPKPDDWSSRRKQGLLVFPAKAFWQEPAVSEGDTVRKKQLLARGVTHIYFQANVWIFAGLVFVVGIMMGIGKAAVYKHIPDYFPRDVGVVGGMVGLIGGLGGFFCPIIFGYLLEWTGLWTTCWMFLAAFALGCLLWMHRVVQKMMHEKAPALMRQMERPEEPYGGFAE